MKTVREPSARTADVVERIAELGLDTLAAAVAAAGLEETLAGPGPFTVFGEATRDGIPQLRLGVPTAERSRPAAASPTGRRRRRAACRPRSGDGSSPPSKGGTRLAARSFRREKALVPALGFL